MENLHIFIAGLSAIILFVFGLDNFSKEIEKISGEKFRKTLSSATRIPIIGVLIGAVVTAVIQSSSATSVITISLVNAGVLSFKSSVGIIFGSNIGTTVTAQMVAFKLTAFAPIFIIIGFALSLVRTRWSIFAKAIFYFGFVFFSLNLISSSLSPLQNNEALIDILTQPQNPLLAILIGCLFTAAVQSSSVTTGLAIIFTQQGILGLENAVPLIMGANIGTTATALIAMFNMDIAAKKTALSHFLFNFGGVLLFLPALLLYGNKLGSIETDPAIALATIHLIFNVVTSVIFIIFINPFTRLIDVLLGEGKMDFARLELPKAGDEDDFEQTIKTLETDSHQLFAFLQENYNLVTLSIESNYPRIFDAAEKRIEYFEFVKKQRMAHFAEIIPLTKDDKETREVIRMVNQFDYLFQIHDSIVDLFNIKKLMQDSFIELRSDILLIIRELSSHTLTIFDAINKNLSEEKSFDLNEVANGAQKEIDRSKREILALLAHPDRNDAAALINFVTYSQRLKDKLVNFCRTRPAEKSIFGANVNAVQI